ncbi:PEP-CTERM sorting domain-containing protein [Aquincola sp. MAHUQ-54]|uniref:PEP-CTERM sorting domain-containing protein n=1 Tax=Aquincola agrisoli TaxID=3119538 RepID=A0AAW9Q011_9BURK
MTKFKKLALAAAIGALSMAANASSLVFNFSGAVNSISIPDAYADLYDIWYESADFDDFYGTVILDNYENYLTGTHTINIAASNSPLKLSLVSGLLTGIEGTRDRSTGTFTPDNSQLGTTGSLTLVDGKVTNFNWSAVGIDSPALASFNDRTLGSFPVKISSISVNVGSVGPNVALADGSVWSQSTRGTAAVVMSSPVPEPSTYAMLAAGLAAVGLVARRRRSGSAA